MFTYCLLTEAALRLVLYYPLPLPLPLLYLLQPTLPGVYILSAHIGYSQVGWYCSTLYPSPSSPAISATAYLTRCLHTVCSQALLSGGFNNYVFLFILTIACYYQVLYYFIPSQISISPQSEKCYVCLCYMANYDLDSYSIIIKFVTKWSYIINNVNDHTESFDGWLLHQLQQVIALKTVYFHT